MIDAADFVKWCEVFGVAFSGGGGGGSVTAQQVQQLAFNSSAASGVDDHFIVNLSPAVTSLTNGLIVEMNSGALQNLTTAPTLQINALTPVNITLWGNGPVAIGDIGINTSYLLVYDLPNNTFQLINPSISTANTFLTQSNFYNTAIDSGVVNVYAGTLTPPPQGTVNEGFPVFLRAANTNTANSTLSVNSVTNPILLANGNQIPPGSIVSGMTCWFVWNSVLNAWVLMNPVPQQTVVTLADNSATFPNSFSLGSLASGLLKQTVTAGVAVPSIAINGTDYWAPGDVIVLPGPPANPSEAATKGYVDSVAAGIPPNQAAYAASTGNLTGYTYLNGTSGVGATLTAGSNGAFTLDGTSPPLDSIILYKNDTTGSGAYNGVYTLTTVGDGSTPAVLTRATWFDTPAEINVSGLIPVVFGTVNAGTGWLQVGTITTVGTDALVFIQFGQTAGIIPLSSGGTQAALVASNGGIVYSNATQMAILAGTATANQMLQSGASGAPHWSTSTYPTTNAVNTLLFASAANVMSALATANNGVLVTDPSGVPSISATLPDAVQLNITKLGSQSQALNMNSHLINAVTDPVSAQDAATKNYVDSVIAGFNPQEAVNYASTTGLTVTYSNGASGVGATLTNADTQAVFALDGSSPSVGMRVLIKNQASSLQNGVYVVTNVGSISTNWVLTRAANFDAPVDINASGIIPTISGTVNAGTGWLETATVTTIGTDPIVFIQFGQTAGTTGVTGGGTGLTSVAQGDLLYGSAPNVYSLLNKSTTATRYLSNQGVSNNPAWSQVDLTNGVTGINPVANGGTGKNAVTTAPLATSWAGWDANSNLSAVGLIPGFTAITSAGGTTILTVASNYIQQAVGTLAQTFQMPVAATLQQGQSWQIINNSTGTVTVNSSGGNLIISLAANTACIITCILTSGTSATSWTTSFSTSGGGTAIITPWVAYTPTFTGFGTPSGVVFSSRRVGSNLEIMGRFQCGTTTPVQGQITMGFNGTSANVSSNATVIPTLALCGNMVCDYPGAALALSILVGSNVTYMNFGCQGTVTTATTPQNGNILGNRLYFIQASIPISGW